MNDRQSYEYINNFLFFVLKPYNGTDKNTLLYCSGVNINRFLPITRGRHRPMSNPAIRGLQLVNLGVRSMVLSSGATPKTLRKNECSGIVPPGDIWSTEHILIENAHESLPQEIINYSVIELLRKIDRAIILGASMPEKLPGPDELEAFLDSLCIKYK